MATGVEVVVIDELFETAMEATPMPKLTGKEKIVDTTELVAAYMAGAITSRLQCLSAEDKPVYLSIGGLAHYSDTYYISDDYRLSEQIELTVNMLGPLVTDAVFPGLVGKRLIEILNVARVLIIVETGADG